ncbi:hypothetical protein ASPACDRAFT_45698 [Aspergillus aculeatus ATCC 16872]|uniref:Uncharacterized protein n=1 Tax=Aspergillus aculeatus (strain ATCC 16872 / CBS 172.66 / WB 5094) TaxID=690307 RepID=A0A1L9WN87_ASPA1|nr:uncharacterized protein ASPACDRAFT_45698 [Aspergillus aculeatus ATCC 16872]OJJ97606.1 hypothetical protein ASPACDRAFT_45698 [Aspergillus aculeatus ATCC 16872]
MQLPTLLLTLLSATAVMALPSAETSNADLAARGDSGCYPVSDPDCGISTSYCRCANGWYYLFNSDEGGCNPPWGIVATDISGLPGWNC